MDRRSRLSKGREFDTVYQEGAVVRGPFFILRHLPNDVGHPRWGFAVGKRLLKHATGRNRMKRRLREAARHAALKGGFDIILTARAPAEAASLPELVDAVQGAARRAGIPNAGRPPE